MMKKELVAAGFVLFSFMLPLKANAFTKLYVFGDSLSDTGNLYNSTRNPQTGIGLPPPPYFQGRSSNGPIWIDQLAQNFQLKSPTLYTDVIPGTTSENGINFAFAGATSIDKNTVSPLLPGFQQQIAAFTTPLLQSRNADSNALYIVWAGANDYLPTNADPSYFTPFTDPRQTIDSLRMAVASLADVGAKNIVVVNLPDLGRLPRANNLDPTFPLPPDPDQNVSKALTALTTNHNSELSDAIANLNDILNSDVNLISLDANFLFADILQDTVTNGGKYGFQESNRPCLFDPCVLDSSQQDKYVFWDGIHPTAAVHKIFGDYAYQQIAKSAKPVPEPSTALATLTIGAWGAAVIKRKRKQPLVRVASQVASKKAV
jgi:phospholipase/lecithinase/hemolysin